VFLRSNLRRLTVKSITGRAVSMFLRSSFSSETSELTLAAVFWAKETWNKTSNASILVLVSGKRFNRAHPGLLAVHGRPLALVTQITGAESSEARTESLLAHPSP